MYKLKIVVDVDLPLCNPAPIWMAWLKELSTAFDSVKYTQDLVKGCVDYNLGKYYKLNNKVHSMSFWEQPDLYDNITCYKQAVDSIKKLYEDGHDIIFASYCFPQHETSKINMLKRDFSFIDKKDFHFISTKSKGFIQADVVIEDRIDMLNQFDSSVLKLLIHTPYTQTEEGNIGDTIINIYDWTDVYKCVNLIADEDEYV